MTPRRRAARAAGGRSTRDGSFGWYDLTITVEGDADFKQQLAGHVETGRDSVTDPALGT